MTVVGLSDFLGGPDKTHNLVQDGEALERMIRVLRDSDVFAFDTETTGLRWYRDGVHPVGLSFASDVSGESVSWYVPIGHDVIGEQMDPGVVAGAVNDLFRRPGCVVVGHNIKFDIHQARQIGIVERPTVHDTLVLARMSDENRRSMKLESVAEQEGVAENTMYWNERVAAEVLRMRSALGMTKEEYLDRYGYSQIPLGMACQYAGNDAHFTLAIFRKLHPIVAASSPDLYANELRLTWTLVDLETAGVPVDLERCGEIRAQLIPEMDQFASDIEAASPVAFDPSKDDQVRNIIYGVLGLPVHEQTKRGLPSVSAGALSEHQSSSALIRPLLEWRQRHKIVTTYTQYEDLVDSDSMLHTTIWQAGAKSGRFASSGPNLQNIPARSHLGKLVRTAFPVRPGWCRLYFDYSQVELRVIAWIVWRVTGDRTMLDAYIRGEDIHAATASLVFGAVPGSADFKHWRSVAKTMNFGLGYGGGPGMLARNFGMSMPEAQSAFAQYHTRFPAIGETKERFWDAVRARSGNTFRGMFGRVYREPRLSIAATSESKREMRAKAERDSFSKVAQGGAADLVRYAMVRVDEAIQQGNAIGDWEAMMVLQVHDEIEIDVAPSGIRGLCSVVRGIMENFPEFAPMPITIGGEYTFTNWAEKKEIPGW